jgi:hypothetical protein
MARVVFREIALRKILVGEIRSHGALLTVVPGEVAGHVAALHVVPELVTAFELEDLVSLNPPRLGVGHQLHISIFR